MMLRLLERDDLTGFAHSNNVDVFVYEYKIRNILYVTNMFWWVGGDTQGQLLRVINAALTRRMSEWTRPEITQQ